MRLAIVRVALAIGGLACASAQPERIGDRMAPGEQPMVAVGRNVRVSGPTETPYHEMVIAANPRNRGQLVGSSMVERAIGGRYFTHIFASRDGGRTWLQSHRPTIHNVSADPQVVYTWSGAALYAGLGQIDSTRTGYPAGLEVFRSADGGLTWQKVANMGRNHDRLIFFADHHSERFRGRVYLAVLTGIATPPDTVGRRRIVVYRSLDDGQTWLPPVNAAPDGLASDIPAILSDGTIFLPVRTDAIASMRPDPSNPDSIVGRMASVLSVDGGETFGPLRRLPDYEIPPGTLGWMGNHTVFGAAITGPARDRAYMVKGANRGGFLKVEIAHSDDRGATWSAFRPIDRSEVPGHQYNASIAVNKEGVVGVSWLDTRHSKGGTEYDLYFAASLDGGKSFEAARRVSEVSSYRRGPGNAAIDANSDWPPRDSLQTINTGTVLYDEAGGHYLGLTADSAGVFHPLWPDARTGIFELYTARIHVRRPRPAPAALEVEDVTSKLRVVLDGAPYDTARHTYAMGLRVVNESADTLFGPIQIEVKRLSPGGLPGPRSTRTDAARRRRTADSIRVFPVLLNANNGLRGVGAIYELGVTHLPLGYLPPREESLTLPVTMMVPDPRHVPVISVRVTARAQERD